MARRTFRLAHCPVCGEVSTPPRPKRAARPRRLRTDLQPDCWDALLRSSPLHMCPVCGFAGSAEDFAGPGELPYVVDCVWQELAPRVRTLAEEPAGRFEAAARIAVWRGEPSHAVGALWLKAAWCCVSAGDAEAERYYRRLAVRALMAALEQQDLCDFERPLVTYVVGELWRRIGDDAEADWWLSRVGDELRHERTQAWLLGAAIQQRTNPQEWLPFLPGRTEGGKLVPLWTSSGRGEAGAGETPRA